MKKSLKNRVKKFDWIIAVSAVFLFVLGCIAIFSATIGKTSGGLSYLNRQLIAAFAGMLLFLLLCRIDYRALKKMSFLMFVFLILILASVLIFGSKIKGMQGWIKFPGGFGIQPVEIVKIAMIIILAKFFSRNFRKLNQFKYVAASLIITLIPVVLVLFQPDIGSALVVLSIWAGLVLSAGIKKKHILILLLLAFAAIFTGWKFMLKDYQKLRITAFLNPYSDPKGSGYNAIQSVISVGSGGIFGKGIGNGSQGRLNFLPERHTDFIFANIAEELGFAGSMFLLILYGILLFRIIKAALSASDNFAKFLAIGVALMIFTHILENIGMNIGIMPITGIPLPLVSYGGSNLLATLSSLGLIESILIHNISPLDSESGSFIGG